MRWVLRIASSASTTDCIFSQCPLRNDDGASPPMNLFDAAESGVLLTMELKTLSRMPFFLHHARGKMWWTSILSLKNVITPVVLPVTKSLHPYPISSTWIAL